jgi:glycosyl transferase family 2
MKKRKPQAFAYGVIATCVIFGIWYLRYLGLMLGDVSLTSGAWILFGLKTGIELIASFYGIAFLFGAIAYLAMREDRPILGHNAHDVRVGLVYLCCDDLDANALESLSMLSYTGPLVLVIHDDSRSIEQRTRVDELSARLRAARGWDVHLLRRRDKSGGKAAAVNYVLAQTGALYDVFLLCDNDSTVLESDTVDRVLPYFADSTIAVVQCRTVAVDDASYCPINRKLAQSIAAFHAFLAPSARFGWMPFIGHNAFLRTRAVREVGGLTPGFFSDDLDLTVRLNLAGFRVEYASEVALGEKHPPSYAAFRKRSYKWAYGCVQTLQRHWRTVLISPQFTAAEKLSFFQFAAFYCLQSVLLVYLTFILLVLPFGVLGHFTLEPWSSAIVGTVMIGLVYAPLLSFVIKTRRYERGWAGTVVLCGLVYGGTDFSVLRGVFDAFSGRQRRWVPTNQVGSNDADYILAGEAAFGLLLLGVPFALFPQLLYLPCWYLFAGKFLFGLAFSGLYRDAVDIDSMAADARVAVLGNAAPERSIRTGAVFEAVE